MTSSAVMVLPELGSIDAALARRSLWHFVRQAWPLVEPETPFVNNWHIKAICDHLEAVSDGRINRLLLNVPPGSSKSLLVSVFWPCWEWIRNPGLRVLSASYSESLSVRDNLRVRQIVESEWYRKHFHGVEFRSDQNQKIRMDTTASGWRIATSVGGRATGEHPDRIIIDDPHSAKEAESDAERQSALDWFDRTISTRGIARGVRLVVIMQRLHELDLSGHLLERGGWTHLCLPMRFESGRMPDTPLGWNDPRTERGELLWPTLFTDATVTEMERNLRVYGAAGQLQQRPSPESGGLFKREWFQIVDAAPAQAKRCRGWDTAGTAGGGDYTVGVKLALAPDGTFYVEHVVRDRLGAAGVDKLMRQTAETDGRVCRQREEQEPGSSGKAVVASHVKLLVGYDYSGVSVTGDKVTRARPFRAQAEAGNVKLVRGEWNTTYLDELVLFPNGAHDDQVDGSSCAFNELAQQPAKAKTFKFITY